MYKTRWAAILGMVAIATLVMSKSTTPRADRTTSVPQDPVSVACHLPKRELVRLWRGFDARRSEDIIVVPRAPNYFGSFSVTSHTGPWDYVQEIPLVLYGPDHIRDGVQSDEPVGLVDVYPTIGRLLGVRLSDRAGMPLEESLRPDASPPAVVVVVIWDGVGTNVLERWPDAWPHLRRFAQSGTWYSNATVGSSPSITPASHSTLGTGAWPRAHRVTAIKMRIGGRPVQSFRGLDPGVMERSTFADDVDRAFDNRSKVGLVAWQPWHLGMLGHGGASRGGDRDVVAIIRKGGRITGNRDLYSTPAYLSHVAPGIEQRMESADRADGVADGFWRDDDLSAKSNPAWVHYQADVIISMLEQGRLGIDDVPDLLLANFKMTDLVGHSHTMDSPEMAAILAAQDRALARIVRYLERARRDFVLVLTADHGHTPAPEGTGAWPISQTELIGDLDERFRAPAGESLVDASHAAGFFLNRALAERTGTDARRISLWLNAYTLGDNAGAVPDEYSGRADERLFAAAFPAEDLDEVMGCAFGTNRPPWSVEA